MASRGISGNTELVCDLYTMVQVKPLSDVYLFESPSLHRNDVVPRGRLDQNRLAPGEGGGKNIEDLERDPQVGFVMKQIPLPREPRGYAPPTDPEWSNQWTLVSPSTCVSIMSQ